jgi:hypothetical protein
MSRRFSWSVLGWLVIFGALFAVLYPNRAAPLFWDEHCYVGQARFIASHFTDFSAYRSLDFVRPPLFTGALALLIRYFPSFGPPIETLRLVTCALGLLLLPLIYALCRQLGGQRRTAWLAVGLCAFQPLYVAQLGLVLSDVPTAVLTTAAWLLLLRGRIRGFVIVSTLAVLTKESAYFLCAPAFLLLWWRGARTPRALWPAFWPGVVLFLWLVAHRFLVGQAIPSVNGAMVGITSLPEALLHNLLEGGRLLLISLAVLALRGRPGPAIELRATAVAVLALPLLFPATLPRYMLLSLPLLCVFGALGLETLSALRRLALGAFYLCVLLLTMRAWPWHGEGGYHQDATLVYRALQRTQLQAAEALAAEQRSGQGTGVVAHFPMFELLHSGPLDGFAAGPVEPTILADENLPLETVCRHRFLVDARVGVSVEALRRRLGDRLRPWAHFGSRWTEITIYEIRCK